MPASPQTTTIVVLDGYTLNPGDLTWSDLSSLGLLTVHDRTAASEVVARARDAEIVLTNKVVLNQPVIADLPRLRYIGLLSTGTNVVDLAAAKTHGITVTNVPAYSTPSVAQLTFALLLELTHHVGQHADTVRQGQWTRSPDFCYWTQPLVELRGQTMGLIGLGQIGQAVAGIAHAFGMRVLATNASGKPSPLPFVTMTDLDTLLGVSDVVSLHCPLTETNRHLINADRIARMKPTAYLINTSRGLLIHEPNLAAALQSGHLAGVGLDVLSTEPPSANNPLLNAPRCIITPHIAWATLAARQRLMRTVVENVRAYLNGQPQNVV